MVQTTKRRAVAAAGVVVMTPAAVRILDTASELFYLRGIRAVGMDLIAERAGTTKKTIYDRFGSKDRLVAEYLERRDRRWRTFLTGYVEEQHEPAATRDPWSRVLSVFCAIDVWRDMNDSHRGCAFVNASAELPDADHPARKVIAGQKVWLRDYLQALLAEAGRDPARDLADALLLVHEGAIVAQSVAGLSDAGQVAGRVARDLLAARPAS